MIGNNKNTTVVDTVVFLDVYFKTYVIIISLP